MEVYKGYFLDVDYCVKYSKIYKVFWYEVTTNGHVYRSIGTATSLEACILCAEQGISLVNVDFAYLASIWTIIS